MASVAISIAGREYQIACPDGQQDHLRSMAGRVDAKARELISSIGMTNDAKLLAMVSIMLVDEIADIKAGNAPVEAAPIAPIEPIQIAVPRAPDFGDYDRALAEAVNALADRVEAIAKRFESN